MTPLPRPVSPAFATERRSAPSYSDHTDLSVVIDGEGRLRPIASPADWNVRSDHILFHLQSVMGQMPGGERRVPLDVEELETEALPGYERRKVTFAVEPGDRVPAWLLVPDRATEEPAPAALVLHPTYRNGKDEQVGIDARPNRALGKELAERGYVVLAPDYPNFGEYEVDPYALGYASASMKAIWNNRRGVDLLASMPEVDERRIAAIGHSLGGHTAIFTAVFEPRIRAVVSSCGFNSFPYYYKGNLAGWSHRGYMPRLRSVYGLDPDRVPFDFPELIGALAPRPFFTNSPLRDANFDVRGVRVCIAAARFVYDLLEAPGSHLTAAYPDAEHDFPPAIREHAKAFLNENFSHSSVGCRRR